MLLQFYFSNYRSFEGEGILDMRASGSNELSEIALMKKFYL